MRNITKICSLIGILFLGILFCAQAAAADRKVLFDDGWKFQRGVDAHAALPNYDDSLWRTIDLPHDWSIELLEDQKAGQVVGPFSRQSEGGFATGQTMGGEGWYRKQFTITPEDVDKRHVLYFEGIYNQSEIWINGQEIHKNMYGYTSFRVDVTPYCHPAGQPNIIAVKVMNIGKNSRWYSGSGIYRHVWLIRTSPVFIEEWGTFVRTVSLDAKQAEVKLSTQIMNQGQKHRGKVEAELLSPQGTVVAQSVQNVKVDSGGKADINFHFYLNNPQTWSVDTPYLYSVRIRSWKGKKLTDEYILPFGIRTLRFSIEKGFELNGIPMKLKGGCVHHDNGLLGAKAFDRAEERKIELLKANGFNAVRTSHNPMSESFLNACDRLGILVVNEIFDQWEVKKNPQDYHLYFKDWSAKDVQAWVLRDRNHPSVILWSIGNEIRERAYDDGLRIANYLKKEVLKYDNTRPITAGINKQWDNAHKNLLPLDKAYQPLDVVGHNYMWRYYEKIHQEFPQQIMFGSESVAKEAAFNWDKVEELPYVMGDFIWTAMDYLGESGLGNSLEIDPQENVHQFMDWPWFNAWCGDLDLLGIKKPQSYYRDVLWNRREISLAIETPVCQGKIRKVSFWGWPEETLSWTFPGMEGKDFTVNAYTRASKVYLYLNNSLIGEKQVDKTYKATFKVPYQPGTLKAVTINKNGEKAVAMLETISEAVALRVTADRSHLTADGQDLSFVLIEQVDCNGNVVTTSGPKITISSKGDAGSIIASGTASPTDMHSFQSLTPTLFNGRAMVIVRSGKRPGNITVSVKSEHLRGDNISIQSNYKCKK